MNLCEAQWLAYVPPCRRFAAALTDDRARLGADVVRYSVIASDLHRLLVAGFPGAVQKILDTIPYRAGLQQIEGLATQGGPHPRALQQDRETAWRFQR
jgi:hypothetical protein